MMDADWSVECAADDPFVVIPWKNVAGTVTYIDLRLFPDALLEIQEAAEHSALAAALRRWNQPHSPIFTAKCDVWVYPAELFDMEDLPGFAFAQGSYVDILQRDPVPFASLPAALAQLRKWSHAARATDVPDARSEWTLRRALIFPPGMQPGEPAETPALQGYATSLYVWGYGLTPVAADAAWAQAIHSVIPIVLTTGNFTP